MVKKILEQNKINVLCMQETEITNDIDRNELNIPGYRLEIEQNLIKARVGFYVSKSVNYVRRTDLEGINSNLIIIDLEGTSQSRIICTW